MRSPERPGIESQASMEGWKPADAHKNFRNYLSHFQMEGKIYKLSVIKCVN